MLFFRSFPPLILTFLCAKVDDQIETELAALAAAKNSIQEQIEGLSARKITLLSDISDLKILISKLEREAAAESRVSVTAGSTPVKA